MSDQLPELRASDADREGTAEVLRHAAADGQLTVDELEERVSAAYAARTRRELQQLTADVSPAPAAAGHASGLTVKEGAGGDRWVISIMGGHDKRGRWRVAARCTVLNIMGGSEAPPGAPVIRIRLVSIMGGSEVTRGRKLSRREKRELREAERLRELER